MHHLAWIVLALFLSAVIALALLRLVTPIVWQIVDWIVAIFGIAGVWATLVVLWCAIGVHLYRVGRSDESH